MSALGIVIAQKLIALNQAEKAAVLEFCIGYGVDSPLNKSADAALLCLQAGILSPAEHVTPCTCCAEYRPKTKKSSTFTIRSKKTGKHLARDTSNYIVWETVTTAIRFISAMEAMDFICRELESTKDFEVVQDGGDK